MSEETIEKTFTVPAPAVLNVANIRGSIQVVPGAPGIIQANIHVHPDTGDMEHTQVICEQAEDGAVTIKVDYSRNGLRDGLFFGRSSKPCKVDMIVHVPGFAADHHQCSVLANGVSCDIHVSGVEGAHVIKSVSGDAVLSDLHGELALKMVSGDTSITRFDGALEANLVSGDLALLEGSLASAELKTVSGDVRLTPASIGAGPFQVKSVSGDVFFGGPDSGRLGRVDVKAVSGRLAIGPRSIDGTSSDRRARRGSRRQQVVITEDGADVQMKSVSGNLVLELPEGMAQAVTHHQEAEESGRTAEASEPVPTMDVLNKIAAGELSVEDALHALSGEQNKL